MLAESKYSLLEKLTMPDPYRLLVGHMFSKTNNKDIHTLAIIVGIGVHILSAKGMPIRVSTLFAEVDAIDSSHSIWAIDSVELKNILGFFLSDPRRDTYWAAMISKMIPYLDTEIAKFSDRLLELVD